jgi:hypothetical protein
LKTLRSCEQMEKGPRQASLAPGNIRPETRTVPGVVPVD